MQDEIPSILAAAIALPLWIGVLYLYVVNPTRQTGGGDE